MYLLCMCQLQAYLRACATGCIAQVVALEARLAWLLRQELLTRHAVDGAIRDVRTAGMQAAWVRGHVAVVKYLFGSGSRDRKVPLPDLTPSVSDEVWCGLPALCGRAVTHMNCELIVLLRGFCRIKTLGWLTALAACVPSLQQWARRLQQQLSTRTPSLLLPLVSVLVSMGFAHLVLVTMMYTLWCAGKATKRAGPRAADGQPPIKRPAVSGTTQPEKPADFELDLPLDTEEEPASKTVSMTIKLKRGMLFGGTLALASLRKQVLNVNTAAIAGAECFNAFLLQLSPDDLRMLEVNNAIHSCFRVCQANTKTKHEDSLTNQLYVCVCDFMPARARPVIVPPVSRRLEPFKSRWRGIAGLQTQALPPVMVNGAADRYWTLANNFSYKALAQHTGHTLCYLFPTHTAAIWSVLQKGRDPFDLPATCSDVLQQWRRVAAMSRSEDRFKEATLLRQRLLKEIVDQVARDAENGRRPVPSSLSRGQPQFVTPPSFTLAPLLQKASACLPLNVQCFQSLDSVTDGLFGGNSKSARYHALPPASKAKIARLQMSEHLDFSHPDLYRFILRGFDIAHQVRCCALLCGVLP